MSEFSVVIPTIGRASLWHLLSALAADPPAAGLSGIVVVDDRRTAAPPLPLAPGLPLRVLRSGGRGPAVARNIGWRAVASPWVVFLDDDVVPEPGWWEVLRQDLRDAAACGAVGSQGVISVPEPPGRPPTDDERRTLGLAGAQWITADMAYRRDALVRAGGFDARFPRAYREDSDLALRITGAGGRIIAGRRRGTHPIRRGTWAAAVRAQAGNRDDALMRRKHGPGWRRAIGEGPGRPPAHTATTAAACAALTALLFRRPRPAAAFAALWLMMTAEFTFRRFRRGAGGAGELLRLTATSALIPPAAIGHRLAGQWRFLGARTDPPLAVLFDRDDTLIEDGPYLADPDRVRPLPGAQRALQRLRRNGLLLAVVTNQSGVAKGLIDPEDLAAVNARVETMLGPFDSWQVCVHDDGDGCGCRKPRPGMVLAAAEALGVDADRCVLIGDTGGDVAAALAARARAVLVPTGRTLPDEVAHAHARAAVARTLNHAVSLVLKECR